MSTNPQNKKRFINLVKELNGGISAFDVDNAMLSGLREPKLVVTLVQPTNNTENAKYQTAKFYLSVQDALTIYEAIMHTEPTKQKQELFLGRQGSYNKKPERDCLEARVFTLNLKLASGKVSYEFAVENCKGVQSTVKNGAGEEVPGIVNPATGKDAKTFAKCSFSASRSEAVYIASMIYMEIQAWRNATNVAMYFRPNEFRYPADGQPPTLYNLDSLPA